MQIALIGNQNSGKSTLFNTLTGSNQKIGNWPGVTLEKKVGIIRNTNYKLIDLPGIYSLNAFTSEEVITTNFLKNENIDVIINIIDCNSIARGLFLTLQLLEKYKNVIVALNMHDIAEKKGIKIDEEKLEKYLGKTKVIKISAIGGEGTEELVKMIDRMEKSTLLTYENNAIRKDKNIIENNFNRKTSRKEALNISSEYQKELLNIREKIITEKYNKIDIILKDVMSVNNNKKESITDKIDKIILNKFLAFPIFIVIMFGVYFFSIDIIGEYTGVSINFIFEQTRIILEEVLLRYNTSTTLISLLTDGIIKGVSSVLLFLPQLTFIFVAISILEKIGYMSRISLIFDKLFKKIGLSGNSIIPFIIGTGCSVPRDISYKNNKK